MVLKGVVMTIDAQAKPRQPGILWPMVIIFATTFLMGWVTGYLDARHAQGGGGPPTQIGGGLVLLAGIAVMGLYLRQFGAFWQSWSRRKWLYMASLFGAGLLGLMSIVLIHSGQSDAADAPFSAFFSDSALSPKIAVGLALIWGIGISIAACVYHWTIDDHEERAYLWAGLAGYYSFVIPAPIWWVLARASLAPPVDAMLLFLLSLFVNCAVYLWLKFR